MTRLLGLELGSSHILSCYVDTAACWAATLS